MKHTTTRPSDLDAPHITTRPFDVDAPGTKTDPPEFLETIEVEVENRFGESFLTQESRRRIEEIRARHMGLMTGGDIKAMRRRLGLTQKKLTGLLKCGEKMLSHWENGHGFPTGLSNTMLRLLDEGFLAPASLEAVSGPRSGMTTERFLHTRERNVVHYNFQGVRPPKVRPSADDLALASSS